MNVKSIFSVILSLASIVNVFSAPAIPGSQLLQDPANTPQRTAAKRRHPSLANQANDVLPSKITVDLQGLQALQAPNYNQAPMPAMAYAPQPYPAPSYYAAPAPALPNLIPQSSYAAPNPCDACNTCSLCATPTCAYCQSTCQSVTCGPPPAPPMPNIPKALQPLWQQWNEKTADMTRMEMSALIMSPAPKLPSATKAKETEAGSGDNSGSASDEEMNDEDLYDAAEKRSDVTGPVEKGKNKAS